MITDMLVAVQMHHRLNADELRRYGLFQGE